MTRLVYAVGLCFTITATMPAAAPVPVPVVTVDPLPKGATARHGSLTSRGKGWQDLAFSADGKRLLAIPDVERVDAWDADTGKSLPAKELDWPKDADDKQGYTSTIAGDRVIWITRPSDAVPGQIDLKAVSTAYASGSRMEKRYPGFGSRAASISTCAPGR
jgi:hypothetical protein